MTQFNEKSLSSRSLIEPQLSEGRGNKSLMYRVIVILFTLLVFLFSVELMGEAFSHLNKNVATSILQATSNPFIALFIGLLVTALIQSSSTVTSMIIALVAAGSINFTDAIPIIMGANIGTTLTSTIVSLGYISKRDEFKRAIAAGTVHDFFNILTVLILFPLEYYYGVISELATFFTSMLGISPADQGADSAAFSLLPFSSIAEWLIDIIDSPILIILVAFTLLFGSIKFLSRVISRMLMGEQQERLRLLVFDNAFKSFAFGTLVTGAIQSSSVTTSVVVPFAATGKIGMNRIMPFILGANIGTTITAFLAAMFRSDLVVSIAMTHLIINLIGVLIFIPIPLMRKFLINLATLFGEVTARQRVVGLLYIILTFFLVPFALIYANKDTAKVQELVYSIEEDGKLSELTVPSVMLSKSDIPRWGFGTNDTEESLIQVYGNEDYVIFGGTLYLINPVGYCWDENENDMQVRFCVEDIEAEYALNGGMTFDSVYVYSKNYPADSTAATYRYYLAPKRNLIIQTDKLDTAGNLLRRQRLIEIR